MGMRTIAEDFMRIVDAVNSAGDLDVALAAISARMGFQYYALTHHVDMERARGTAIRLHNYPERWVDYFDRNRMGMSDPVHRASHVTSIGFPWSRLPQLIPLTSDDRRILSLARGQGIGDGFTVPANVPGEAHGSCSFATADGVPVPMASLPLAQLAGAFAFEGARRLWCVRDGMPLLGPALTDRQRDCVLWMARGKSDWEISRILGVGEETVVSHVKQAREKYGAPKRTLLAIRTLFDGTISFTDVLKR